MITAKLTVLTTRAMIKRSFIGEAALAYLLTVAHLGVMCSFNLPTQRDDLPAFASDASFLAGTLFPEMIDCRRHAPDR